MSKTSDCTLLWAMGYVLWTTMTQLVYDNPNDHKTQQMQLR